MSLLNELDLGGNAVVVGTYSGNVSAWGENGAIIGQGGLMKLRPGSGVVSLTIETYDVRLLDNQVTTSRGPAAAYPDEVSLGPGTAVRVYGGVGSDGRVVGFGSSDNADEVVEPDPEPEPFENAVDEYNGWTLYALGTGTTVTQYVARRGNLQKRFDGIMTESEAIEKFRAFVDDQPQPEPDPEPEPEPTFTPVVLESKRDENGEHISLVHSEPQQWQVVSDDQGDVLSAFTAYESAKADYDAMGVYQPGPPSNLRAIYEAYHAGETGGVANNPQSPFDVIFIDGLHTWLDGGTTLTAESPTVVYITGAEMNIAYGNALERYAATSTIVGLDATDRYDDVDDFELDGQTVSDDVTFVEVMYGQAGSTSEEGQAGTVPTGGGGGSTTTTPSENGDDATDETESNGVPIWVWVGLGGLAIGGLMYAALKSGGGEALV